MKRIEKIAKVKPKGIILREKDLEKEEYKKLAESVIKICKKYGVECILHSYKDVAVELNCTAIHLTMKMLENLSDKDKEKFKVIGVSCHSADEAKKAEKMGCTYIVAGHIFETDCKKGIPGRGIDFLESVCSSVSVPVYAIGGISAENIGKVKKTPAKGACVMSGMMLCEDAEKYMGELI